MRIKISTKVEQSAEQVLKGFDLRLFEALKPPLMPLKVLRFDGCETDDEVHLDLGFGLKWLARIIDHGESKDSYFFVDEGVVLPFPLKSWTHRHEIVQAPEGSTIVDDIEFSAGFVLLDLILYPFLYSQFFWRKHIYVSRFGQHQIT